MESTTDRWTEIRTLHHDQHFFYQILGGAALVALGILLGAALFGADPGYSVNIYTEILSIGVTVFILNALAERREDSRRENDLKAQLIRDAGSQSNEAALRAVNEIAKRKWLIEEDGLLRGADLSQANLAGAHLHTSNLQNANLFQGKLQNAYLFDANMQYAMLWQANLQHADLTHTDLEGADLGHAKLQYAKLLCANLQASYLGHADLKGADLSYTNIKNTNFDENTTLPDATYWTPQTDMNRFTDPNHPNFWRSSNLLSPAHRSKTDPQ